MQRYLRERIDWPQAFPAEEYALRRAKLRGALAGRPLPAPGDGRAGAYGF